MPSYDVLLIHPPAVYDFRRKPLFTGALGPSVEGVQFTKVPIGMLSIAEYLDRHGFKVLLDNIGDRMVNIAGFDVEQHIRQSSAQIFAVGMHFQQHAQGAIEIARIIKQLHPHSLVVLGGLTATCFHREIIEKYPFVDGVVRAEAEKAMLAMVRGVEQHGRLTDTPNLTYRSASGEIRVTPLLPASENIDEFEYTRFDLLDPRKSTFGGESCDRYSLEVCRGCIYNCTICGGSAYTYKKHLGMSKPAFRSPAKIVADMKRLNDMGIFFIGLFQDMRMGGKKYWQELLAAIAKEKPRFQRLSLDLLAPADEEFISAVADVGRGIILHFCPDSGCEAVRRQLGRNYSTSQLLDTIRLCHNYDLPVTNFFSVGLAGETEAEMQETWSVWEQINEIELAAFEQERFKDLESRVPIGGSILGPIVIDPGSLAFEAPEKYGYKLLYKNLEEYIAALNQPSWHQWLNYETALRDKKTIVEMIRQSIEFTIDQNEKYGYYTDSMAGFERVLMEIDRVIVQEIDNLEQLQDPREKNFRIIAMRKNLDNFLRTRQLDVPEENRA